jgi:hypothetical protein
MAAKKPKSKNSEKNYISFCSVSFMITETKRKKKEAKNGIKKNIFRRKTETGPRGIPSGMGSSSGCWSRPYNR